MARQLTANRVGALVLIAAAVLGVMALIQEAQSHKFTTTVPAATNLISGTRVTDGSSRNIGGIDSVDPIDGGRRARITIEIKDDKYWPVRRDAELEVRYGGTISFSNRYLRLHPGVAGPELEEGDALPAANVTTPTEIDQLVNEVTPEVQDGLKRMIKSSSETFDASAKDINKLLPKAPPLSRNLSDVFLDLINDKAALRTLVQSTQQTVEAVDRANPDLRVLLDGAGQTFDAIADESDDLQVALDRFPAALRQTRSTLGRAEGTLTDFADLAEDLAPGVSELRETTPALVRTLNTLEDVTPAALNTLRPTYQNDIDVGGDLLRVAGNITPRLKSIGEQADTELACVRPYTPEIVLLGTTWGDWISPVDERDHLLRATVQNYLPAQYNSVPFTPADAAETYPGLEYGFPRPPGTLAKQPWFLPECGAGEDALDPAADQEGQNFREDQLPPELRP